MIPTTRTRSFIEAAILDPSLKDPGPPFLRAKAGVQGGRQRTRRGGGPVGGLEAGSACYCYPGFFLRAPNMGPWLL